MTVQDLTTFNFRVQLQFQETTHNQQTNSKVHKNVPLTLACSKSRRSEYMFIARLSVPALRYNFAASVNRPWYAMMSPRKTELSASPRFRRSWNVEVKVHCSSWSKVFYISGIRDSRNFAVKKTSKDKKQKLELEPQVERPESDWGRLQNLMTII